MTDTTQTPGPIQPITSFPNYGSFFPSFPFQGLNSQFGASMQPFGGGYGGWGMPQQYGMGGGWPSLFGGGMGGYGGGYGQQPFGGMGGGMMYAGGSPTFNEAAGAFPFGVGAPFGYQGPQMGQQQSQQPQAPTLQTAAAQQPSPQPQQPSAPMQQPSWSAAQLAAANGISPGLADFMLAHNARADSNPANQQFYQAAGFTNPAGSQTMLNSAGRDWLFNNNQYYANINADAGQPNGPRLRYGMMGNTPYSYSPHAVANNPAFQQWFNQVRSGLTPSGPAPAGVNVYSQFGGG